MAASAKVEMQANIGGFTKGMNQGITAVKELGNQTKKSAGNIKSLSGAANAEKRAINELALQYHNLTDAEKAAFGPTIKSAMDSHIAKLKEYKAVQADINAQVSGATTQFGKFGDVISQAGSKMGLPIGNLTSLLNPTTAAIAGVAALGAAFVATAKKTMEFDSALNDLSVKLNVPADQLKQFGDDAIDVGNKFGISATDVVKQFQYMAEQAPGLEKDREGMLSLADASNKLSVAFGTDVEQSTNAVMTVLSKFNLTAADSADIANTLAEACRNTGADLEYQSAVFEKVGSAANASGISYQELASATGVLSSTFSDASVVGAGLNTMITKLQKASDEYNPAVVGLEQAITNMANANLSYADIVQMVGPKAAQVTQVLIDQQGAFSDLQSKMENTQAAEEMFGVKSEELGFVINKIKTMWENFLLKIGESAVFQTIMGIIGDICKWIEELSTEIQEILNQGDGLDGLSQLWGQIREAIKAVLPVIGTVIKVFVQFYNKVYAIIADVIKFWINMIKNIVNAAKTLWTNIKNIWNAIYSKIADNAVVKNVVKAYEWLRDEITKALKWAADKWNQFVGAIGFDSLKITISGSPGASGRPPSGGGHTKVADPSITEPNANGGNGGGHNGNGGGHNGNGGKKEKKGSPKKGSPKKDEPEIEEGTLAWYDKKISELQKSLKEVKHTDEEIEKIYKEIADLTEKRRKEEQRIKSLEKKQDPKLKTIKDYDDRISELNKKLKEEELSTEEQRAIIQEIVDLEKQRNYLQSQQDREKKYIEFQGKISKKTFDDIKKKFGGNLKAHIDLFADVKTDKDAWDIAKQYTQIGSTVVKLPVDLKLDPIKDPLEKMREMYDAGEAYLQQLQDDFDKGLINEQSFLSKFEGMKAAMEDMGWEVPLKPVLKKSELNTQLDYAAGALNQIGDAIGAIAQVSEDEALNVAGTIAQAIANIWLGYSQATAQAATMGPWAWAGFAIAGLAQAIGVVSAIKSNQYAEGGIIQGPTTMGDQILARVNAGEMILNQRQQNNLFNAIDSNRLGGTAAGELSGTVRVKGSDLYIALNNYNKITGKKV